MANAIGYEELVVEQAAVGPTASLVQGGVASAVFYVDDEAPGAVRWRPTTPAKSATLRSQGFPLKPGAWIAVAGEGNIRNSLFELSPGVTGPVRVHVIYFDRVDMIAADFAGISSKAISESAKRQEGLLDEILLELRKHTDGLREVTGRELEAIAP